MWISKTFQEVSCGLRGVPGSFKEFHGSSRNIPGVLGDSRSFRGFKTTLSRKFKMVSGEFHRDFKGVPESFEEFLRRSIGVIGISTPFQMV